MLVMGGLGAGAFWRRRRPSESGAPDPAAALRARLDATKAAGFDEPVVPPAPEPAEADVDDATPAVAHAAPVEADPAARRVVIHERARGAIDELS